MTNNNGGPAFPVAGSEHNYPIEGMTLRDYFAAKALQSVSLALDQNEQALIAAAAYAQADAMLRAREAS
ncbi:hypothetical protein QVM81_10285 [Enterobacter rongchengensis]|uniref:Uncharacterized protein n=1 Tax=Enterobacter rongchengensis TaxID=3030999 RepID=A0ABV4JHZ2_9ENTR